MATESTIPHLVLLHAFPLHGAMWEPQIQALEGRIPTYAPNLPGFGGEPGLDEESLTMKRAAAHILGELDAHRIERCILCGLSMGGYVAFECIRAFPERIAGLILADTRASADDEQGRKNRYASIEKIARGDFDGFADGLLEKLLSEHTRNHNPELVRNVRTMMNDSPPESAIAALFGMAARADSTELLSTITIPTALIYGEEDAITTVKEGKGMAAALPDATLTTIPNAGHLSNLEAPEEFNQALGTFLKDRFTL